jgi:REP element-mobilizing transposase RayT
MARPRRNIESGEVYHLTSRGNNGQRTFRERSDHLHFLALLEIVATRYGWTILAYCLMSNHYHLVVRAGDLGISDGMRDLNGGFARWSNRRYGRTGHLWRNRFFAKRLENEAHALLTCRYVVLNAVRARMCRLPEEYVWSSYRASVGLAVPPRFLKVDEPLALFCNVRRFGKREYRLFVAEGVAEIAATTSG